MGAVDVHLVRPMPFTASLDEDVHWHDLRHTFASRLVMAGVDIRMAQKLMGHKTITMTLKYSHLSPGHQRDAVQMLISKPTPLCQDKEVQFGTARVELRSMKSKEEARMLNEIRQRGLKLLLPSLIILGIMVFRESGN